MTVVYLDAFLVLNFVVNYLLLACAGKLDGEPVVGMEWELLQTLVPELPVLDRQSLSHPVDLLRDLEGELGGLRLQLLPYRAVGVECGMLLALRVDRARYGPWEYRNCLTALSPTPLSDGGGYCALIGGREGA